MQFLAIVKYSHGGRIVHEFRCPLERRQFVKQVKHADPGARIKFRTSKDIEDYAPTGEEGWYDA